MVNTEADLEKYTPHHHSWCGPCWCRHEETGATGLVEPIKTLKKPVLGICVGMQLLTNIRKKAMQILLDIVPVKTKKFDKISEYQNPAYGMEQQSVTKTIHYLKVLKMNAQFYFVHSYFIEYNPIFDIATADYGLNFSAAVQKDNFYGVQFHPEKSGAAGEQLLKNFSNLKL